MNVAVLPSSTSIGTTASGKWVRCSPDRLGPTLDRSGHAVQRIWIGTVARIGVLHADPRSIRPEDQDPIWQIGHPQVRAPELLTVRELPNPFFDEGRGCFREDRLGGVRLKINIA